MNEEKNFNEENEEMETVAEETATEETVAEDAVAEETVVEDAVAEEIPVAEATAEEAPSETEEAVVEADTVEATAEAAEAAVYETVSADSEESVLTEETTQVSDDFGVIENQVVGEAVAGKKNVGAIIAIAAAAVVVIAIVITLIVLSPRLFNKYNRQGYVNISGATIDEVAEQMGMELDEFLESFGLPKDMPANTTEAAAYNNIPFEMMAQTYGRSTEDLKQMLKLPDDVDDKTPWGEAINKATLGAYVGEDYFAEFKEYYGFGDEVTVDTLWGDVRQTVEEKQRQERIESEKAQKEAEKAAKKGNDDEAEATPEAAEATPEATTAAE